MSPLTLSWYNSPNSTSSALAEASVWHGQVAFFEWTRASIVLADKQIQGGRQKKWRLVADAGCDVEPEWANGALLRVPMTEEHLQELGLELQHHHVVALTENLESIRAGLPIFSALKPRSLPGVLM